MIETIVKRDGRQVPFDPSKITDAIYKAAQVLGGNDREMAEELTQKVIAYLTDELHETRPAVEQVQDAVEKSSLKTDMPVPPRNSSSTVRNAPACAT